MRKIGEPEKPDVSTMAESWTVKIGTWLKEGKEDSKTILGIPWDTEVQRNEEIEQDIILATHPKFPYRIGISIAKQFASLHIDPGILTDALDVKERMRIYKKLLHINTEFNQMKTGLLGIEDQIIISVDLNLFSLSKTEFNDALTLLVMGAARMIEDLGLTEDLSASMMERNAGLIMQKLAKGETREEVLEFLIQRVGLNREYAEKLLENVVKAMEAEAQKEEGEAAPQPEVKPAPETLYR